MPKFSTFVAAAIVLAYVVINAKSDKQCDEEGTDCIQHSHCCNNNCTWDETRGFHCAYLSGEPDDLFTNYKPECGHEKDPCFEGSDCCSGWCVGGKDRAICSKP